MKRDIVEAIKCGLWMALPFLVIYFAWFFSLASFDLRDTFKTDGFWTFAFVYWIVFLWIPLAFTLSKHKVNE